MVITTRFELSAPIEAAWAYLLDVPKIAHCVPGASLTDVIDDKTYAGKVDVKLGPIGVSYKGRITIQSMDESAHTVSVRAAGSETRGRGGASATMTAQLQSSEKGTSVIMNTDLVVSRWSARPLVVSSRAVWNRSLRWSRLTHAWLLRSPAFR